MKLYHDAKNNLLVYDLPDPELVLCNVREAVQLHNGYVCVPKNIPNLQLLRFLDLPVCPIVEDTYDWPIKKPFRPRAHQKTMTNFMVLHPRCCNLSDMGTMKTLATLWAADFLVGEYERETGRKLRALVVAPLSILQRTWGDAILAHLIGRRDCVILHGTPDRRLKLLNEPHDFYIINYEGVSIGAKPGKKGIELHGLSRAIAEREDIGIVIIDEVSAYRDSTSRRSRVARVVLRQKPYLWALTGTPTSNGPLDAYGLARLVNPRLQESFTHYRDRVMYRESMWKWLPKPGAHAEAMKLLQPAIRFEMRECTDVPPCTEQMRDVELSAEQKQAYKKLKADFVLDLQGGKQITAAHEAVLRLKLLQISCGAIYDAEHGVTRIDASPRIAELKTVINEAARKIIIFAPLTSVLSLIYDELKEWSREIINGNVPLKERNEIFRKFQGEKHPHILIADPATMSHGLDLFAADVVVWYGATDRTELYLQANRRIDRPGQTTCTTIVQLAATAVEREIYRRCASNQGMQGAILKLVRDGSP